MNEEETQILLLTRFQYCHIIDNNTGVVKLVEGPFRGPLNSNEMFFGSIQSKIIVREGQYAVILNPYCHERKDIVHGDREIRKGPRVFALFPGEELEQDQVNDELVLVEDTGVLFKALRDFEEEKQIRKAGDLWIVQGPSRLIPHKYAQMIRYVHSISLGIGDGFYVKNIRSGKIRLEKGPRTLMLSPEEELFPKPYSQKELEALNLARKELDLTKSIPLQLVANEVMLIIGEHEQRVEFGPQILLLGPFEHPYIMNISGSTPKRPNINKLWKVFLGPVFVSDQLIVRTKDNAELCILLRYKTRFKLEETNPLKVFTVEDFIGFATETMAGMIREQASQYNFEDFHAKASYIVKEFIFSQDTGTYTFQENGFEIFGIDIKKIMPSDPEIAAQLNAAIKSNMDVYVKKIQQTAELEAEQQFVQGKIEIEKCKRNLIILEQENYKQKTIEAAKIDAIATVERAQGDANAVHIKKQDENELQEAHIRQLMDIFSHTSVNKYLLLEQITAFANLDKTLIIPNDTKLMVPFGDLTDSNVFFQNGNIKRTKEIKME